MNTFNSSSIQLGRFIAFASDTPDANTGPGPSSSSNSSSSGLGGGVIAGIVVGAVALLAVLIYGLIRQSPSPTESEEQLPFSERRRSAGSEMSELQPPRRYQENAMLAVPISLSPILASTAQGTQNQGGVRDSQISHVNLDLGTPVAG
ncbi:hypothetical protein MVEG_10342 [Podila verticillata NRRL 6337]|nr:hypothetical protein MVEG_10342 [Podila verticillata NRRL 6337]